MKTNRYLLLCSLCILFFIGGCADRKTEKELPVLKLSDDAPSQVLKMSEILDDVRIIPLETRNDVLLPGFFYAWVGDKYIVTLGQEEIHLFSADGKYIRKIAQQGRGPEEYLYILSYWVDEKADRLYLSEGNDDICIYDLNAGKLVRKDPLQGGSAQNLIQTTDGSLLYIPVPNAKDGECEVFRMKPNGTFMSGIPKQKEDANRSGHSFLSEYNDTIRYKLGLCDTVFVMQDTAKIPYCCIKVDRPYSLSTHQGGTINIEFENRDLFVVAHTETVEKQDGEMFYVSVRFLGYYLIRKADFELKKISGFYVDILDYTNEERFPFLTCGKRVYKNLSVLRFKEMMKDKLDNPLVADYLKTLYHQLSEDDNPMLIVGTKK